MKKLLTILVAVIIVISAIPVAFAHEECAHIFNESTLVRPEGDIDSVMGDTGYYICPSCNGRVEVRRADYSGYYEALIGGMTIECSVYSLNGKAFDNVRFSRFIEDKNISTRDMIEKLYSKVYIETEQDELDSIIKELSFYVDEYKAFYEGLGLTTVIDVYDCYKFEIINPDFAYRLENYSKGLSEEEMSILNEKKKAAYESFWAADGYLGKGYENPAEVSQSEFDLIASDYINYWSNIYNCCIYDDHDFTSVKDNFDGTHSISCSFCFKTSDEAVAHNWGEYISDNNATTRKDGTKTAKCIECNATNTIVDEGSKLEDTFTKISDDLYEFIKMFIALVNSFIETVIQK